MTPLEQVLTHAHTAHCRRWACACVVWVADDQSLRTLDRDSLAAGRLLSEVKSIRRAEAGPTPHGVPARFRPFLVRWSPNRLDRLSCLGWIQHQIADLLEVSQPTIAGDIKESESAR